MKKLIRNHLFWILFLSLGACYGALTLPALLSTHHILYNLEPYPDGLLYTLTARNFIQGEGLALHYAGTSIPLWVPPLYPLVLTLGYLIWFSPAMFYLTNAVLGLSSLLLLMVLVKKVTDSPLAAGISGVVLVLHGHFLWLPTVPMSENLALPLFLLAVSGLLLPKPQPKFVLVSALGTAGLGLTRFALLPVVGMLGLLWVGRLLKLYPDYRKKIVVSAGLVGLAGLVLIAGSRGQTPLQFIQSLYATLTFNSTFFNSNYLLLNARGYLAALLGNSTAFLWLQFPFTSAGITLGGLDFLLWQLRKSNSEQRWQSLVLFSLLLSLFPLLLVFYTVDTRYIILAIPLLAISWGLGASWLLKQPQRIVQRGVFVAALVVLFHLITQLGFYQHLVATNVLHRSVAWQYQAIQHFNYYFSSSNESVWLVTALPPHLVQAYQMSEYRLLPLSPSQEFLQKGEHVWGNDIYYQDLAQDFIHRIQQGQPLYISNAYVTHQQPVIQDFERLKQQFTFELVSEGCEQACNIYRLLLR